VLREGERGGSVSFGRLPSAVTKQRSWQTWSRNRTSAGERDRWTDIPLKLSPKRERSERRSSTIEWQRKDVDEGCRRRNGRLYLHAAAVPEGGQGSEEGDLEQGRA
jgi:hypothetical protein